MLTLLAVVIPASLFDSANLAKTGVKIVTQCSLIM